MPSAAGWLAERERISESKIEFPATEKKVPSHGIPVVQGKIVIIVIRDNMYYSRVV